MLRNNNMAVISRMAAHSLKSHKRRSLTMILTVFLSAFMLFSVLTVGITFLKMQKMQNLRLQGADYDAIVYGVTEEQQKLCEKNPDIKRTGIMAVSGYVEETDYDKTPNVGLIWADDTYWEEMAAPAVERVDGSYPQAADEVLVTKEALEECGLGDLKVGDTFPIKYGTFKGSHEMIFRISGIWEGYGAKKVFYVSRQFYEQSGFDPSNVGSGRYLIQFENKYMTRKEQDAFIESLNLEKQQRLFYTADYAFSIRILAGIAGLVLVTCLCAYLLIYNIMYLSVTGNIRYYGLLQTIGMTERQIRNMIQRQMMQIGGAGIFSGLAVGAGVSFFLIPVVVKSMGIRSGRAGEITVAFHPAVFAAAILITGLTVLAASRKPAKIACNVTPIEALGYHPASGSKKTRKSGQGSLLFRMAKEQISRDKKKTGIVMLSLAAGLSVFLCVMTLLQSQGAREWYSTYRNFDMVLVNDTVGKEEYAREIFDAGMYEELYKVDGVKKIEPLIFTKIIVPWEPDLADKWMEEFYAMWMYEPYEDAKAEYQKYPENFGSSLVGIGDEEFAYLNQSLDEPVDEEAFFSGKTCVLFRNDLDFKNSDLQGKQVTCALYDNPEKTKSFEVASLTDTRYYTALLGYPPTIIVSSRVLKEFAEETMTYKLGIFYEEEFDEAIEMGILNLMQNSPDGKDFSYESRIKTAKAVKRAQGSMMEVGIGIVMILALIGIMNYVNTSAGNVQSRLVELSVMESVGMTDRQMKKMLIIEGLLYAGGSWILTMTIGLGMTYWVYQAMNYNGASFAIPVLPVLGAALLIGIVCVAAPVLAYRRLQKQGSVVERIQQFE